LAAASTEQREFSVVVMPAFAIEMVWKGDSKIGFGER
jgi:hypothetical protein